MDKDNETKKENLKNDHKNTVKKPKRKRVQVDSEYQWESLHHKSIRMNERNVNQNLHDEHEKSHKKGRLTEHKMMVQFAIGCIIFFVFLLFCIFLGKRIRSGINETQEVSESSSTEADENTPTGDESEEETTASKYLIEENVAPPNDIENLDIIGGNGELIGFSFPDQQCEKWMLMEKQIDKVLHASGYNADFKYAVEQPLEEGPSVEGFHKDKLVKKQIEDIEELVKEGAGIIFVAPGDVSSEALAAELTQVKNSGIYVIAIDHVPMGTDGVNFLFGCDDYHVGETMGNYIVDALDLKHATAEEPKTAEIFTGDMSDETLYFRFPGLMEALFPYIDSGALVIPSGQVELEQVSTLDNSESESYERMKELLAEVYTSGNLDAVICTDDVLAGGVSRAMAEAVMDGTYGGTMPVITGDGSSEAAMDRILQGKQSMSVFYDPAQYAFSITELVDDIYHGTEMEITDSEMYQNGMVVVPAVELIPAVVTAENYEDMIVDTGYLHAKALLD